MFGTRGDELADEDTKESTSKSAMPCPLAVAEPNGTVRMKIIPVKANGETPMQSLIAVMLLCFVLGAFSISLGVIGIHVSQ